MQFLRSGAPSVTVTPLSNIERKALRAFFKSRLGVSPTGGFRLNRVIAAPMFRAVVETLAG